MDFIQWLDTYKWVILFYSTIVLLVFAFRHKFDIHHKFLAMYRTKIGLKLMDRIGVKHAELVKVIGYMGIGVGYVGMFYIAFFLIKNLAQLILVPSTPSAVSLVIPGVPIPGSPITIPLITGWIALFIVILIHEFSHGVVARAHKLDVKSSGIFFMGPLMGAFVEPEEKKLRKASDTTQYSVYAAGPWSNVLLALVCLFVLTYVMVPVIGSMENDLGVEIVGVTDGYPAKEAGIEANMVVSSVNGNSVNGYNEFVEQLRYVRAGETVVLTANGKDYEVLTAEDPSTPGKGYLGVMASSKAATEVKNSAWWYVVLHRIIAWLGELISITGLLSFGIGLANLLPLGPVDGGRMLQVSLEKITGPVKGLRVWKNVSIATLLLLVINLCWPLLKNLAGSVF